MGGPSKVMLAPAPTDMPIVAGTNVQPRPKKESTASSGVRKSNAVPVPSPKPHTCVVAIAAPVDDANVEDSAELPCPSSRTHHKRPRDARPSSTSSSPPPPQEHPGLPSLSGSSSDAGYASGTDATETDNPNRVGRKLRHNLTERRRVDRMNGLFQKVRPASLARPCACPCV